ncbi:Copper Transporter integral membrane protein that functions in high affinity copper transport [Sticta canariensis]|nr:Copper Transporter integral membrane protein that functions in high affinity copper transport [Sticta canariensis]
MFWNWNTIDACFVISAWHITSGGMFAACCIGLLCLTISFEALGRMGQKYDKYILRQFQYASIPSSDLEEYFDSQISLKGYAKNIDVQLDGKHMRRIPSPGLYLNTGGHFRPNLVQQVIRAGIYMIRFGVAYFIMLLAMTLNGYFILVILMGTYMGSFFFRWESSAAE